MIKLDDKLLVFPKVGFKQVNCGNDEGMRKKRVNDAWTGETGNAILLKKTY
jgi:hypothetical protein